MMRHDDLIGRLAELTVRLGANMQPGQIVAITSEPGKEPMARAVADAAYRHGALFVEVAVFDAYVKRARALHADPDTLPYIPPWLGHRMLELGAHKAAYVSLAGPAAPHAMDGIDPGLLAKDTLPRLPESSRVVNDRSTNWTVVPCPTPGWAQLVHPDLDPEEALDRLWDEIAHICRLDESDPVAGWQSRIDALQSASSRLGSLRLDALRFDGPGTELTVGLLPTSIWNSAMMVTVGGIRHLPNIPTEEVFTTPDPERVDGVLRSTKPLFTAGTLITGLRMRFEKGRVVAVDADHGAETLREIVSTQEGADRIGEVALVDSQSRVGQLDTVFFETLLDENAASHMALGQSYEFAVGEQDRARANRSAAHIDFMIGSDQVAVTGLTADGGEIPLLRDGAWCS